MFPNNPYLLRAIVISGDNLKLLDTNGAIKEIIKLDSDGYRLF